MPILEINLVDIPSLRGLARQLAGAAGSAPSPSSKPTSAPSTILASEAAALASAIAQVTGRAVEHVHLIYEPPGRGRVAFGGELL